MHWLTRSCVARRVAYRFLLKLRCRSLYEFVSANNVHHTVFSYTISLSDVARRPSAFIFTSGYVQGSSSMVKVTANRERRHDVGKAEVFRQLCMIRFETG